MPFYRKHLSRQSRHSINRAGCNYWQGFFFQFFPLFHARAVLAVYGSRYEDYVSALQNDVLLEVLTLLDVTIPERDGSQLSVVPA